MVICGMEMQMVYSGNVKSYNFYAYLLHYGYVCVRAQRSNEKNNKRTNIIPAME